MKEVVRSLSGRNTQKQHLNLNQSSANNQPTPLALLLQYNIPKPIKSMKTILPRPISRRPIHSLTAVLFLLILSSCSNKVAFNTSTVMPTAEGSVKVNRDNNSNYSIDIHIKHLANP